MKIYGDIHDNLSEKEKVEAANRYRNLQGWFDKIWETMDFRGHQKDVLLAGDAVTAENDKCVARYQLSQHGDLTITAIYSDRTVCSVVNRLSGERQVEFYVTQPFSV